MQDVKITFRVRVYDDESRVIITNPTTTDSISFGVFMGIVRSLADFVNEWNEEHKPERNMPKYKWIVVALLLVALTIIVILLNTAYGVILAVSELIAFGLLYKIDTTMKQADYIRLTAQIAVLKEIAADYSGKTIDNIIQQLEAIKKEVEND